MAVRLNSASICTSGLGDSDADVVLYCTQWCPGCARARTFFKQNKINYVEIDINRDREAAKRVRGRS